MRPSTAGASGYPARSMAKPTTPKRRATQASAAFPAQGEDAHERDGDDQRHQDRRTQPHDARPQGDPEASHGQHEEHRDQEAGVERVDEFGALGHQQRARRDALHGEAAEQHGGARRPRNP